DQAGKRAYRREKHGSPAAFAGRNGDWLGGLGLGRLERAAGGKAGGGELIAVAVAPVDGDPVVGDRLVEPALEIAVAHAEEVVAREHAARRDAIAHENVENLAADVVVGIWLGHGAPGCRLRVHQ